MSQSRSNSSLLCVDFDGTLVDTAKAHESAIARLVMDTGRSLTSAEWDALESDSWFGACERLAGITGLSVETASARLVREVNENLGGVQPRIFPGAHEFLAWAQDAFAAVVVVTASPRELIDPFRPTLLKRLPAVTARYGVPSKPSAAPYLAALDLFGMTKDNAIALEDSETGKRSAQAAGIRCLLVDHRDDDGAAPSQGFDAAVRALRCV